MLSGMLLELDFDLLERARARFALAFGTHPHFLGWYGVDISGCGNIPVLKNHLVRHRVHCTYSSLDLSRMASCLFRSGVFVVSVMA